jgi:hypothetical protein
LLQVFFMLDVCPRDRYKSFFVSDWLAELWLTGLARGILVDDSDQSKSARERVCY